MGCVYLAQNKFNGKRYVGKTSSTFRIRRKEHLSHAKKGSMYVFHQAIKEHGPSAFIWSVLLESSDVPMLTDLEIKTIRVLNTQIPNGYNMTPGGDGVGGIPLIGNQQTKSERFKIRSEHRKKRGYRRVRKSNPELKRINKELRELRKQKESN